MPEKDFRKWYLGWHEKNGAKLLSDKGLYDYMLDSWMACESVQQSALSDGREKELLDACKKTWRELDKPSNR